MIRSFFFILFFTLSYLITHSQEKKSLIHFSYLPNYYNPSLSSYNGLMNFTILHNWEWKTNNNSNSQSVIGFDLPFRIHQTNHGIGLLLSRNNELGNRFYYIGVQYAWKQKISNGYLNVGFQLNSLTSSTIKKRTYHADVGFSFTNKNFYSAIGIKNEEYNFLTVYNISLKHPFYELEPALLMNTDFRKIHTNLISKLKYKNKFILGIGWYLKESIPVSIGFRFNYLEINYGCFIPIYSSFLIKNEIVMRLRLKPFKTKNREIFYKSIRLL